MIIASNVSKAYHYRKDLQYPPELTPTNTKLNSPGGSPRIIGYFQSSHQPYDFNTYVIRGNSSNLLSRKASCDLGFIKLNIDRVNGMSVGLVNCNPVSITLKEDATPFHINSARRIRTPLLSKVEKELEKMEKEGIIEPTEEATDWCAPIVVVPKRDNSARICVE